MSTTPGSDALDFRRIEAWVFDLDNTLYRADSNLFAQVDARMTDYIARLLDMPPDDAKALQHAYYRAYGTTLNGLMALHSVDADDFLDYVHDIDLSMLHPDPRLNEALAALPGRRLVFTNGPSEHAARILDRLGIADLFENVFDIRRAAFVPKPAIKSYRRMIGQTGIDPWVSAFFEDLARNLVPAHDLGMITVWINSGEIWGPKDPGYADASRAYIDFETDDLTDFLHSLRT